MGRKPGPCRGCGGVKPPGRGRKYCNDCTPSCVDHEANMHGCQACMKVWRYNLTGEQLDSMMVDAKCATCDGTENLRVDHDHATGRVRGILCDDCNLALGKVKDSVDTLARMVQYLNFSATGQ